MRKDLSIPVNDPIVGIFAKVGAFKGHYLLAESWAKIREEVPNAHLVCVGPYDDDTKAKLCQIAGNGASSLHFLGTRNDVKGLMSQTDLLTLPSEYEACSMAIIEGMSCGKAVIATNAGGNPELITSDIDGVLIERSTDAVTTAIVSLLKDSQRRNDIGHAAQIKAQARFSSSAMVTEVESLYEHARSKV